MINAGTGPQPKKSTAQNAKYRQQRRIRQSLTICLAISVPTLVVKTMKKATVV